MRLIDADELMEHVWRDKLDSRELIAKMIDNAPTVKEVKSESEEMAVINNRLKDLSERVENIEKQIKEEKEEQLRRLQAQIDYAELRCSL
jgi:molecular chaperone GrpE (heat shock protein)